MSERTIWWTNDNRFDGLVFHGQEAVCEMRRLLQPQIPCIELCEIVGSFFGSNFVLSTYPDADHATMTTYAGMQFPNKVHICVGLNSSRPRESLVHELLHGELLRIGFPRILEANGDPLHWELLNHIQHEIMFPLYVKLGLDPVHFLAPKEVMHESNILHSLARQDIGIPEISIQWSGDRQYLTFNRDARHFAWAQKGMDLVEQKRPGITARIHRREACYNRGEFRNAMMFVRSYGEAASLIGMPQLDPSAWFWMEVGNTKPVLRYGRLS